MSQEVFAAPQVEDDDMSSSGDDVDNMLRFNFQAQIGDVKATPQKKKDKEVKHKSWAIHEISKLNLAMRKLLASTPAPGVLV